MSEHTPETTTPGADSAELVELEAPPAPPVQADPAAAGVEGDELAEDGAGPSAPAPSSTDTGEDDDQGTPRPVESSSSSVSIRERMRQLDERPSSPGFGVVGKFSEARAARDQQTDEDA